MGNNLLTIVFNAAYIRRTQLRRESLPISAVLEGPLEHSRMDQLAVAPRVDVTVFVQQALALHQKGQL